MIYQLKESSDVDNKACVDRFMSIFEEDNRSEKEYYSFIGHLVALLDYYPQYNEQIFSKKLSPAGHKFVLRTILLSDKSTNAQDYVNRYNLSKDYDDLVAEKIIPVSKWSNSSSPTDNDTLISATMVSKDTKYLDILFETFLIPSKDILEDCMRLGFVVSKFGMDTTQSSLFTNEHRPNFSKNLCDKYQCIGQQGNFGFMIQLASAFWALNSLSARHEIFKNAFEKFLNEHKDIKETYFKEQVSFSNYLTSLMLYNALEKQRDNKNIHLESTIKFMEKYENFEEIAVKSPKDIGIEKTVKQ